MTVLSLLPCQDSADLIANITHTTVQKSRDCNGQNTKETCPPFCTCNCCSTARHISNLPAISIFVTTVTKDYPLATIPDIQDQPISIWQPPQLA